MEHTLLSMLREAVPETIVRELARTPSYPVLKRIVEGKADTPLEAEDVLGMLQGVAFIESMTWRVKQPKRFTRAFLERLARFYYDATLHAKTGIFLIETGKPLSRKAYERLLRFTESFAKAYLQNADFFVGLGHARNPRLHEDMVFHVITGYAERMSFCHACSIRIAKYVHGTHAYCKACYEKKTRREA